MTTPSGTTAVFVVENRVIAHAVDFNQSRPGWFTVAEAQEHRVRDQLAFEVVKELSSPLLWSGLSAYDCQRIVGKIKGGHVHIIHLPEPTNESEGKQ